MFILDCTKPDAYKNIIAIKQGQLSINNIFRCRVITGSTDDLKGFGAVTTFLVNGREIKESAKVREGSVLDIVFPGDALVEGTHSLEVILTKPGGRTIQTPQLTYTVWNGITTGDGIQGQSQYPVLVTLINDVTDLKNECERVLGQGSTYQLPPATQSTLGGIKVGSGLSITGDGTLSAVGSSSGTVTWEKVTNKPSTFPPSTHNHDTQYYTESEIDSKLLDKADSTHNHNNDYYSKGEVDKKIADAQLGGGSGTVDLTWDAITDKPSTFPPDKHTHNEYSASTHNHDTAYAKTTHSHTQYASSEHTHDGAYAPTVHTHDNYSLNSHNHDENYLSKLIIDTITSDFNTAIEEGRYLVNGDNIAHAPERGQLRGMLIVSRNNDGTELVQRYYGGNARCNAYRYYKDNTWDAWYEYSFSSHYHDSRYYKKTEIDEQISDLRKYADTWNVLAKGALGNGTNETSVLQSIINQAPSGCRLIFPSDKVFKLDILTIDKPLVLECEGATFEQSVESVSKDFIKISSNCIINGGLFKLKTTSCINISGNNNQLNNCVADGGEHSFYIVGSDNIFNNCTSLNAEYGGFKLNLSQKINKAVFNNCKSIDFKVKGIVLNGTGGCRKLELNNFVASTRSKQSASDCILVDVGQDDLFCVDEVVINNADLQGGESNSIKIWNTNLLVINGLYARNGDSTYGSSSCIRSYAKTATLSNINTDNRIIVAGDISLKDFYLYPNANAKLGSGIELIDKGTYANLENINIYEHMNLSSSAIRVYRDEGVQHKIVLSNYKCDKALKVFGMFRQPPNKVGFIEVTDEYLFRENYTMTGSSAGDAEIVRRPRTFISDKIPSTGTYLKGDIIYNANPHTSIGWVCTKGGTFATDPPIFKEFGSIV